MPLTAILFDLDGTLTDSFVGISTCFRHALGKMGIEAPPVDDLRWIVGPPINSSFARLAGSERVTEGVAHYRERYGDVGWRENHVYDGIPHLLGELKQRGLRLYVATSKARMYVPRILGHFGLDGYFDNVYGCDPDGRRDDKSELIAHVIEQEALDPASILMVGDRKFDAIGANGNGVRCLGAMWGYGDVEELTAAGAWRLCHRPEDVLQVVDELLQQP